MPIGRKLIQVFPTQQPNRILIHKPTAHGVIVAQEIIVKASFLIVILVLKPERLMCVRVDFLFFFQAAPSVILPRPQQVAELVGLLAGDTNLIRMVIR